MTDSGTHSPDRAVVQRHPATATAPPQLSRREREVMDIVHRLDTATAAEIRERMVDAPTYSAVRSTLRILVEKGHLISESDGTRHLYSAALPAALARRTALRHVVRTFFGGSVEGAVVTLLELEDGNLASEERARIRALIERGAEEGR